MKFSTLSIILFIFFAGHAAAGDGLEIELNDGSVIFGEIVSLEEDIYTIKSMGLGTFRIERSKIRTIRPRPATESDRDPLKAIGQKMLDDDEIRIMLLALESDPDFKEILEDPEIMKGVLSGDIAGLMSNPKFLKLLDNPTIQEIGNKMEE